MLPVKPSVMITSTTLVSRSWPSTLPAKWIPGAVLSSSWARRASLLPFSASVPMVSRPTRGRRSPRATSAYAVPRWANCTSISGLASAVAPASMSTVGWGRVGRVTAMAGRITPGWARSRSRPVATTPAVEPAETTAAASPRRTRWQATAMLDRGRRRLASAPSSMPSASSARMMGISPTASCSASASSSCWGRPTRTTGTFRSRTAWTAPATISPGALSPPMASTAIGDTRAPGLMAKW